MTVRFIAVSTLLACSLFSAAAIADDGVCVDVGGSAQVKAIRSQRAAFNTAIHTLDIAAIEAVLAEDVLLITGSDSDVYTGREAQLNIWRGDRDNAERPIYRRKTTCVQASLLFPIAMEYGTWRGGRTPSTASFAAGSYSAKWRLNEGTWLLEVETYMTERCGGSFCPKAEDSP